MVLFEHVIFVLSYTNGLNSYTNSHILLGSYYKKLSLFWIELKELKVYIYTQASDIDELHVYIISIH